MIVITQLLQLFLIIVGPLLPVVLFFGIGVVVGDRIPPPVKIPPGLPRWLQKFFEVTPNLVQWVCLLLAMVGVFYTAIQPLIP